MATTTAPTEVTDDRPIRGVEGEIVVGYDGSDYAVRALARAMAVAAPGARLTVVTVIPERSQPGDLAERKRLLAEATSTLSGTGVRFRPIEGEGEPAEVLLAAAAAFDAALLVVGSRGHGALAGALLGSVSAELAHKAPQDLLIVR